MEASYFINFHLRFSVFFFLFFSFTFQPVPPQMQLRSILAWGNTSKMRDYMKGKKKIWIILSEWHNLECEITLLRI